MHKQVYISQLLPRHVSKNYAYRILGRGWVGLQPAPMVHMAVRPRAAASPIEPRGVAVLSVARVAALRSVVPPVRRSHDDREGRAVDIASAECALWPLANKPHVAQAL